MMRPSWRLNKTLHYSDGLETIAVFPIASGCQAEEPALIALSEGIQRHTISCRLLSNADKNSH
jgi:hypothetical protein